jgi:hypothetical protein
MAAYSQTNSKGTTYYLFSSEVTLRGGSAPRTIYFFTKNENNEKGSPVESIPEGMEVRENAKNGFLVLGRKK